MPDKDKTQDNKRQSGLELMRIICMALIILHHMSGHTNWTDSLSARNRLLTDFLGGGWWSSLAINCFVLITGYFEINYKSDPKKKLFNMWRTRWFYSVIISAVFVAAGLRTLDWKYAAKALFPVLTYRHSFVTTFFLLYFLVPLLNPMLKSLSKTQFRLLCIAGMAILSLYPAVMTPANLYTNKDYSYLSWQIMLYSTGAYIRLHSDKKIHYGRWLPLALTAVIGAFVLKKKIPGLFAGTRVQCDFIVLLASICVFGFFLNVKFYSGIINTAARSMFAVLLIHDDPVMRDFIWDKLFRLPEHGGDRFLWVRFPVIMVIIFAACILADNLYTHTIRRAGDHIINKCGIFK